MQVLELSAVDQGRLIEAIRIAEKNTSGEIRVHMEKKCGSDALGRCKKMFTKLGMHKTQDRNGVLFYLATEDRKFALYADEGIYQRVPSDFWESVVRDMESFFRAGQFVEGLELGILASGEKLKAYFPYSSEDKNELDDTISLG